MANEKKIFTWYQNKWHEGDVRILGAASHGTWLGSVIFDGARYFEGVAPDLDRHCARANESAKVLGLIPTKTAKEIEDLTWEGLKLFPPGTDVYIRPMYWAEEYDIGTIPPLGSSTDFALCLEEIPMAEPKGFTITTTKFKRPTLDVMPVNAKASALYANNARMLREAYAKGYQNAIVTDALGNVAELAGSNVFMVKDSEVFTPVPNGTFLNGITRQRVIGLLRDAGYAVHEVTLSLDDFRDADEIFSTGNMSKVVPVIGFDDKKFPYGPVTRKARELYLSWAHK